jgi:hypothetical protein
MSTTQVSLKIINEFIINEFLHLFKKDKELYKLYLESCYKKSNRAKEMWFRELTFIVTKKVGRHILYERNALLYVAVVRLGDFIEHHV